MKINWKVRLKSGSWWLGIISAVIVAVFAILNLFGVKTSVAASDIMNAATLVLMIPAAIGHYIRPDNQRHKRQHTSSYI